MFISRYLRLFSVCLFLVLGGVAAVNAQDVTKTIEKDSKGQVTIHAPKGLLDRVNSNESKENKETKESKPSKPSKKSSNKNKQDSSLRSEKRQNVDFESNDDEKEEKENKKEEELATRPSSRKKISQQYITNRSVGYRIQVYADNNFRTAKANAQARARSIAMRFPQYRFYLSYKAPAWHLRIGDFKSQQEAQRAMSQIKRSFPSYASEMTIVRDKINVWSYDR
jgi:hypothetical protein